jgi:hypothetical protein
MNKNRNWFLALAAVFLTPIFIMTTTSTVKAQIEGDRFEVKRSERHPTAGTDIFITAVHDKESGIELVCMKPVGIEAMSCIPTGRNWK